MTQLLDLPLELLIQISSYIAGDDMVALARSCHILRIAGGKIATKELHLYSHKQRHIARGLRRSYKNDRWHGELSGLQVLAALRLDQSQRECVHMRFSRPRRSWHDWSKFGSVVLRHEAFNHGEVDGFLASLRALGFRGEELEQLKVDILSGNDDPLRLLAITSTSKLRYLTLHRHQTWPFQDRIAPIRLLCLAVRRLGRGPVSSSPREDSIEEGAGQPLYHDLLRLDLHGVRSWPQGLEGLEEIWLDLTSPGGIFLWIELTSLLLLPRLRCLSVHTRKWFYSAAEVQQDIKSREIGSPAEYGLSLRQSGLEPLRIFGGEPGFDIMRGMLESIKALRELRLSCSEVFCEQAVAAASTLHGTTIKQLMIKSDVGYDLGRARERLECHQKAFMNKLHTFTALEELLYLPSIVLEDMFSQSSNMMPDKYFGTKDLRLLLQSSLQKLVIVYENPVTFTTDELSIGAGDTAFLTPLLNRVAQYAEEYQTLKEVIVTWRDGYLTSIPLKQHEVLTNAGVERIQHSDNVQWI